MRPMVANLQQYAVIMCRQWANLQQSKKFKLPYLIGPCVHTICGRNSIPPRSSSRHSRQLSRQPATDDSGSLDVRIAVLDRVDLTARHCVELFLDMLPRRFFPVIFRQILHQRPHVGERGEFHHFGDDQRPRQETRPIRTVTQRQLLVMIDVWLAKQTIPGTRARKPVR